ncbi:hypothetical protein [Fimbriiglobus ruber]|uniref:Thioredoxin domain-containing protein n=1 Tax=Fimbriiglobus ruber TaxID=1908690 RepID=A0A225E4S4_9BACT|nr:hypothetical protein [Fimbriiglobus ruber]OWK44489.1 hypothetical protein FRUB_02421 [Fimbriiglobus ruber]
MSLPTLTLALALSFPAAPLTPGLPVGQRPGPYSFLVATGPQRGQQTCYVCEQADKPTVVVFARSLSDPLGKLLAGLDTEVAKRKDAGLKVWMTHLTETADLDVLAKWAQRQGLKAVPVGALEDADGPPAYKLNPAADVTVILFVKQKVVANLTFKPGELNAEQVGGVLKEVPKLFEKP